jgi:ribonuclease HI
MIFEELSLVRGIINTTNNQAEVLSLWNCIQIMKDKGIQQLSIVVDSMIVICHMVLNSLPKDPHLCRLVLRSQFFLDGFIEVHFYHSL